MIAELDEAGLHAERNLDWRQPSCNMVLHSTFCKKDQYMYSVRQAGYQLPDWKHSLLGALVNCSAQDQKLCKPVLPICRRFWQWQTGMLMFVVGNIANFVARG